MAVEATEAPPVVTGIPGLTEGRIVHYVLPDGYSAGQHRPAIVVRVWEPGGGPMGTCQLQVFTDGNNDGPGYASGIVWRTSVMYSAERKPYTWHWPEHVT